MRRRGDLRPVFRGVYLARGTADSLEARAAAAALVLGEDQIVCDRAAAYLHGVDAYGLRESTSRALETCVRRGGTRSRRRGVDGRERDLTSNDIERVGVVHVTTPLRTGLDLGCSLPRHRALGVMDEIARRHALTRTEFESGAVRFKGRRGVIQLRSLAAMVDGRSESQRESWIHLEIADAGLPAPEVQWQIFVGGVEVWRIDLAYPDSKVAVEYDGIDFHLLTDEQVEHDANRRRWLRDRGWEVIVVTKEDLADSVAGWLVELKEALRPRTTRFRWELGREN